MAEERHAFIFGSGGLGPDEWYGGNNLDLSRDTWTLPQLCEWAGIQHRTGQNWVDAGLIRPVVAANGSGTTAQFDADTVGIAGRLMELRSVGFGINALKAIADELYSGGKADCPGCSGQIGYMLPWQGEDDPAYCEPCGGPCRDESPTDPNTPRAESRADREKEDSHE